jgi:hypothetical protein
MEAVMKKPSSFAQQIQQAQREVNSWTAERKASVRLEGSSNLLNRFAERTTVQAPAKASHNKR